jgi:hypothetical protein
MRKQQILAALGGLIVLLSLRLGTSSFSRQATQANPTLMTLTSDSVTVEAVFQPFESGWLLWCADGFIYAFFADGRVHSYPADYVEVVSTPPPTPADRWAAAAPFAQVWSSGRLAAEIGWASAPAQTYQAVVIGGDDFGFRVSLPDGRQASVAFGGRWRLGGISGGEWSVTGAAPTFGTPSFPTPIPSPTPTAQPVNAIYQRFEHGFMLWRADQNCVYSYHDDAESRGNIIIPSELDNPYAYCLTVATLPHEIVPGSAPVGLQAPHGVLAQVWSYYAEVRETLGFAIAPESPYLAGIPFFACSDYFTCTYAPPLLTLPDGRVLSCGMRAASSGECYVA